MREARLIVRVALLVSAGAAALAAPAQTPPAQPETSGEAAAGEADGEIVVTATRQEQTISRVPISISAFTQETMDLKGIRDFADVARFTPGVRFDPEGNEISIRGISSGAGAGTTGIYIDDTPVQIRGLGFASDDALPAVFDLERVEVLRGPQGTLFGAGSEGGTVRYITPQPSLNDWSSYARAEGSTTQHGGASYEAGAALGGPIVPGTLGFRVSGWHRRDGGFIDHVDNATGEVDDRNINRGDVTVLRGALSWSPADALKITPSIYYQRRTTHAADTFVEGISDRGGNLFRSSSPEYRGSKDRFTLPALAISYDAGAATLISNTSYFDRTNHTGYDGTIYDLGYYQGLYLDECGEDCPLYPFLTPTGINRDLPFYLSPSQVTNRQRAFTQEVRLQSSDPDARLSWVLGVFYQRAKQRSTEELGDPLGDALFNFAFGTGIEDYFEWPLYGQDSYINETRGTDRQIAAFADATFALTDRLKLTAGGRVARTKFSFVNFADGSQNYGRTEGAGSASETPFTPKLGINFQATPDALVYATWSKGFRVGGANAPVPYDACKEDLDALGLASAPDQYESDRVRSIELGAKGKLFDRKLQLAASIYDIKWKDIQQTVYLDSCAITFTGNLGQARSRGFDVQLSATPVRGLSIDATLGYTQAKYTGATAFGEAIVVADGDAIEGPPWTASLGTQYAFRAGGRDFYLRGDFEYQSRLGRPVPARDPVTESYDPVLVAPAETAFASLRAGMLIGEANLSLFVDNLFDSAPLVERARQDSDALYITNITVRPRTIGLTLSFRQ